MTRLGNFLKLLASKFLTKVAQTINNFFGYFEKPHFYVKIAVATFRATFGNSWAIFTPTSGHTSVYLEARVTTVERLMYARAASASYLCNLEFKYPCTDEFLHSFSELKLNLIYRLLPLLTQKQCDQIG